MGDMEDMADEAGDDVVEEDVAEGGVVEGMVATEDMEDTVVTDVVEEAVVVVVEEAVVVVVVEVVEVAAVVAVVVAVVTGVTEVTKDISTTGSTRFRRKKSWYSKDVIPYYREKHSHGIDFNGIISSLLDGCGNIL